ncbi:hypothetical protein PIB30_056808 [Stylosanthes scabra]|uniref:Uncharacterized protein n=1 Tax=Stylosanthes scabra TaxID=79078 RepID=A0ABU6TJA2_9FABA|nr:hypothetical protein [Stylosanthes scabra]
MDKLSTHDVDHDIPTDSLGTGTLRGRAFSMNQSRFTMRHLRNKLCRSHRAREKIVIRSSPSFGTSASCHSLSKPPTPDDLHQGDQSQHVRSSVNSAQKCN